MVLDSSDFSFASLLVLVFPEYENADPGLLGSSPLPFYMLIFCSLYVGKGIGMALHWILSPDLGQTL